MKARWLTLFATLPLIVGTILLQSCGGVGGPTGSNPPPGSNAPTQNFLALLSTEQKASKYIGPEACGAAACHGGAASTKVKMHLASYSPKTTTGPTQYEEWKQTKHGQNGVTCESCHGPGGAHQATPKNADGTAHAILTFPKITSDNVCGQCHGPQHDEYEVSKHSQLIPDPITATISNPTTTGQNSRCMVCHGGLVRAQYTESGVDPSQMTVAQITNVCNDIINVVPNSATCSTCHDPHAKTGNLNSQGEEVQLYHSETLLDSSGIGPGTTAAQFTAVNQICGQCHNGRGTTATDAALNKGTSRPAVHHSNQFNSLLGVGGAEGVGGPPQRSGTHALTAGQCATCHMPASRHTMTVSYDTGCGPCDTSADAAARASALKAEVVNDLTALNTRMANWALAKYGNATFWDYTSNIPAGVTPPDETKIPIEIKRARHNYYYVVISNDYGVHNPSYTRYLLKVAADNLTNAGLALIRPTDIANIPMDAKLSRIAQDRKKGNDSSAMN